MGFDFAEAKAQARRAVHDTLGASALYQDHTMSTPVDIRVRWHSKIDRFGDNEGAGYAEVIEGIHRVILEREQARLLNVIHTGRITIAKLGGAVLTLDAMEPYDGPYEEIWTVSKQ